LILSKEETQMNKEQTIQDIKSNCEYLIKKFERLGKHKCTYNMSEVDNVILVTMRVYESDGIITSTIIDIVETFFENSFTSVSRVKRKMYALFCTNIKYDLETQSDSVTEVN
jgi:hypothetical protein